MYKKELSTASELKRSMPLTDCNRQFIEDSRNNLTSIINGEDDRTILIVGPCSIHDITSAKDYALRLKELSNKISDTFLVLMRVYFAKPRTTTGWKGIVYDPLLNSSFDMETGIMWTRQLLTTLAELNIPTAAEILDPLTAHYFSDLITWGCIGARTAESQIHREIASSLPMPVAFKNNTDGNCQIAVDGAYSASTPHTFTGVNEDGKLSLIESTGNTDCHIVLRGGATTTNYDPISIADAVERLNTAGLCKKLIIDCSHDNSKQDHNQQTGVFESVLHQIIEGNKNIAGVILESHLSAGNQEISLNGDSVFEYGKSITDACLDWVTTERLIMWGYDRIKKDQNTINNELSSPIHASS